MTDGYYISSELALRWTSLVLSDNKSTLVQVMAWYLNQCWRRSLPPNGVTRPQWVKHTSVLNTVNILCDSALRCILRDFIDDMSTLAFGNGLVPLGNMRLPETVMAKTMTELTHLPLSSAYMCQWIGSALVQIMACHLFRVKPSYKPMLVYCQLDP